MVNTVMRTILSESSPFQGFRVREIDAESQRFKHIREPSINHEYGPTCVQEIARLAKSHHRLAHGVRLSKFRRSLLRERNITR